ncbi:MAG TPA: hypothetical protein VLY03_03820 [Bacteroidota bacterium]|nr:hypothetical protein [Bacteroidota bacterium]
MNPALLESLRTTFVPLGFRPVEPDRAAAPELQRILKRQTWNTNRAIGVFQIEAVPPDFHKVVKRWGWRIAKKVGFFPFFYSLGIQVIVSCKGPVDAKMNLSHCVNKVDNQLAIVQSIFLIDESSSRFMQARTWGQLITGKYQDDIVRCLRQFYKEK